MIIEVELAMLTRMVKRVHVEVPNNFFMGHMEQMEKLKAEGASICVEDYPPLDNLLSKLYERDEGVGFEVDTDWGVEEGTHEFIDVCPKETWYTMVFPDYRLNTDGTLELVETTREEDVLAHIQNQLWPEGDKDHEWDSETVEAIAGLLIDAGYGPKESE